MEQENERDGITRKVLDGLFESFETGSEAYAVKPIDTDKFKAVMVRLGLEIQLAAVF